jgi:hypothetical protein
MSYINVKVDSINNFKVISSSSTREPIDMKLSIFLSPGKYKI